MNKTPILQRKAITFPLLLLSELGALGLFMAPSSLVTLILLGIFALTVFYGLLFWKEPAAKLEFRPGALILALSFAAAGFLVFPGSMAYTHRMTQMAEGLSLPYLVNARILSGGLIFLGFYAFYRLGLWLEALVCRLLCLNLHREEPFFLSNLIFPLSAVGFFLLEPEREPVLFASLTVAVAFCLVISLHSPEYLSFIQTVRGTRRILAGFTALGIVFFRVPQADLGIFGFAAGVLSLPFLYVCLTAFYGWLDRCFQSLNTFEDVTRREKILYLCLFLAAALLAALVFFHTDAFYGTPYEFDVIYTADSPKLVGENAYLSLRHPENDLRQPLFAVFAAPFLGLSCLITRFLPMEDLLRPLLMDWSQIALLLLSNFLLAKILNLKEGQRMLFMGLTLLSCPVLLFILMMEQYIVVYFYLILCLYLIIGKNNQAELSLSAAGGTLLTGLILLPALGSYHPLKQFRGWFRQMLTIFMGFVVLLLCFGRLDIILSAPTQLLMMLQFSGQKLTLVQKLTQYSGFFSQCLFFPGAAADLETFGHASWQLLIPQGFSVSGLLVLFLCLVSAVCSRKDRAARAAGLWLIFSFFILCLLGWGTQENGLILYTLYFGWAVWALLFRLLQKLEEKIPHFTLIAAGVLLAIQAAVNFPALWKLIRFAVYYYPI